MLTPATSTFCSDGIARITSPVLPRFFPDITWTRSPFRIRISDHLRSQADDAHEALVAQLAADRAEDARPTRLELIVDEHRGVLVEADVAAVWTALLLLRAHNDATDDIALLHCSTRRGVLYRRAEAVNNDTLAPHDTATQHIQ